MSSLDVARWRSPRLRGRRVIIAASARMGLERSRRGARPSQSGNRRPTGRLQSWWIKVYKV